MKRIILSIILSVALTAGYAQNSANRTAKTKVSDALALLPAQDQGEFERLMKDLVSTGDEGMDMLTGMFTSVNNVPVNFALSGWAAYVTKPGNEAARTDFARGVVRALENSSDREVKAFYIRLLQLAGSDESVEALAGYIGNGQLEKPALSALAAIGTAKSRGAIADAVRKVSGDKQALAHAVGQAGVGEVENELLEWLKTDEGLKKDIYFALGRTGTMKSLPVLGKAAAKAGYRDEPTQATRSYITLMGKLAGDGYLKEISAKSLALMKKTSKNSVNTAVGAFDVYASIKGALVRPELVKAMDNPSRKFRVGLLNRSKPFAKDREIGTELLKKMGKLKNPEAKVDIITYLGESGDAYYTPQMIQFIGNPDPEINIAAMWAATRLGGKGVPAALVTEMKRDNAPEEVIAAAAACLRSFRGRVNDEAASVVENGPAAARVAALSVLAARRAEERSDVVIAATASEDRKVAEAAYRALPSVVSGNDLPTLFSMLESVGMDYVPMVQKAVVAALASQPKEQRLNSVVRQMDKAGANRARYYVVLAGTGDPRALGIISEGYAKGSAADKEQALAALLVWDGPEAAFYIYDIARDDKSDAALEGYITLASGGPFTQEIKLIMLSDAMEIARTPEQRIKILAEAGKLRTFQSLIFSGGYLDDADTAVKREAAASVVSIALGRKDLTGPAIKELLEKAAALISGGDSSYQREEIRTHLAAFPAAGGFVSIFNGKDLTGWKGLVENPIARRKMSAAELARKQVKADEVMRRDWIVQNGLLEFVGHGYDNICTDKDYGNFEMYIDWKLYAEGTEADAGIYLRGTPQVQMWDTARRNVGAQVGSGGLYNNAVHPSKPLKVADNKLGHWNTFYIKMVGDRVTVVLNGEKVVDNVILENYWDRSQPIFPIDQIELQAHGTRVAYRNIYINELPMQEPFALSPEEKKEGFEVLFDGTNMYKWMGNTQDYIVEDEAIVLYPGNGGGGNLYTREEFGDFIFRFKFMLTPGANNGLGIRTPAEGDAAYVGMELQILDDDAPIYSELEKYQYHGSVYGVIPAIRGALNPVGEWNCQEVIAQGNRIKITLNGQVIVDGDIGEAAKNGTIDGKDHPGLFNKSGHIAFLGHGSVVKFKDIRIKRL